MPSDTLTNKARFKKMLRDIERHKKALGEHRDALRDLMGELEDVIDSTDEGYRLLEAAVEEISGYV